MFSFFRKKDQYGNEVLTQTAPITVAASREGIATQSRPFGPETIIPLATEPTEPQQNESQQYDLSLLKIEVQTNHDSLSAAEEQAAMLHANSQLSAAISILEADRPEFIGQRRLEPWLMLFELYQQQDNREAFDALALEFVMTFEKTPPIWRQHSQHQAQPASTSAYYAFPAKLGIETIEKEAKQFLALRKKNPNIRVDFSKVQKIDALGAAELVAVLPRRNKEQGQLQLIGAQNLITLISNKIEVGRRIPAEAPFWLLLIEIHQILGQQEAFENLAVDYAITYEVSPPSWDIAQAPKDSQQIALDEAKARAELANEADQEAQLIGIITAEQPQLIQKMADLVSDQEVTTLDFSRIDRIDFESAGQILNLAMTWLQQGKQIRIININELVLGLLRVMGIADMLQMERRK
ncbi:STAS domain-containing protein [Deefgea piscis]|uniref:STAS domain-containing protein n=1 Tax=Deefgea piscis TaxID=2739061 RepID=UPI001C81B4EA|nr:STAS domain-containing protein [Deefgea piscis]QZA81993.1 STAS domain-containing protein [Deefgea piscis]